MSNNLPALIDPEATKTLMVMSDSFFKSGLYPNIKNSAGAFAVVQYGFELGLPPMTSMQTMAIIKGKITMMGSMLQTLLKRGGVKITILEATTKNCTLKFEREGSPTISTSFSIEDAKRAGLYKEDSGYMKYPEEMLYWRAMAKGGRRIGSDLMLGVYAREEIDGDDSIIDVTPTEKKDPTAKKFDPKGHKADQTAPPINDGKEVLADSNVEPGMEGAEATPEPSVIDVQPEVVTEPVTGGANNPAKELFEKLQTAIKEVETTGNKFRWKNWLKKHTPEINSLKEQDEGLWKVITSYVAFMNNKKWKK